MLKKIATKNAPVQLQPLRIVKKKIKIPWTGGTWVWKKVFLYVAQAVGVN